MKNPARRGSGAGSRWLLWLGLAVSLLVFLATVVVRWPDGRRQGTEPALATAPAREEGRSAPLAVSPPATAPPAPTPAQAPAPPEPPPPPPPSPPGAKAAGETSNAAEANAAKTPADAQVLKEKLDELARLHRTDELQTLYGHQLMDQLVEYEGSALLKRYQKVPAYQPLMKILIPYLKEAKTILQ